jgi:hypothetical protein
MHIKEKMPVNREDIDPKIEDTGDKAHRMVRAGLGLLPYGSGTAVELFSALITPPLEKRKHKWMTDVTEAIQALEKQQLIEISNLFEDEEFITLLVQASSIAIKNHKEEKLEALKNAVINSISGQSIDEQLKIVFLNLIDRLSVAHLKIIELLQNPRLWAENNNLTFSDQTITSSYTLIQEAFPEFDKDISLFFLKDLQTNDLVEIPNFGEEKEKHTTVLGDAFYKFIKNA